MKTHWMLFVSMFVAPELVADTLGPLADIQGSPERGRQVFVEREAGHCVLCHQVGGLQAPFQGNLGPALSGIGARLSAAQIRLRIADASVLNPDTIMPPYYRTEGLAQVGSAYRGQTVLTAEQIEHLVAWLSSLTAEQDDG